MSRTYRRKGTKVPYWAYNNKYELVSTKRNTHTWTDWLSGEEKTTQWRQKVFIQLPKREWIVDKKSVREYHSDKFDNVRKKWVKRVWAKKRRSKDRAEMHKTYTVNGYDPTWFTTKIDTWWWD